MPETGNSDYEVMQASVNDPARFDLIFERYHRQVFAFAARHLGRDDAADVTADVFERALKRAGDYRDDSVSALAWLLGIARNVVGDRFRYSSRRNKLPTHVEDVSGFEDELVDRVDAGEQRAALDAALAALDKTARDAFLAHVVDGLTYTEAAAALGIPPGTVASGIARARKQLREALE